MSFVDTARKMLVDTLDRNRKIEAMAQIPAPWKQLMDQQGISSIRELAKIAGLPSHNTINPVIMKGTTTSPEHMQKVAWVLKVPVEELYQITSGVESRPLTMPAGTEKLSERAKNAVAEIIRVLIEEEDHAGNVHKKTVETAEQVQEKTASVTPIGGRRGRVNKTPAEHKFEVTGRKVAKTTRDMPQETPKKNAGIEPTVE